MNSTITAPRKPIRTKWQCGFCNSGNHGACRGATLSQGKIILCNCTQHPTIERCLECGNTRPDELTDWACTNPADCRDAIALRSANNPLREELAIVRALGGEARRQALHERSIRLIRQAVAESGIDEELGDDRESTRPKKERAPRAPRQTKPTSGSCICGGANASCVDGPLATKGGKFAPGHDASLKSALKKAIIAGDGAAYDRMVELGWERFANDAVQARAKQLAKTG